MGDVRCDIVVPLYNKVELTERCVETVRTHSPPGSYRLILVDNASTDGTAAYCSSLDGDDITVIRNDENLGFAGASNQGAAAGVAPNIVLLNNDTEVHAGWLEPLLAHLDDHQVGAVGSKLLFPDGTIQHCGVVLVRQESRPDWFTPVHWLYGAPADHPEANVTRRYQVVTAACMAMRRDVFDEVGRLDEGFWNGYEDVDLCLNLGAAGYDIVYEPSSVVTHFESASGSERFRKVTANERRLNDRWAERITPDIVVDRRGEASADPRGVLVDQPPHDDESLPARHTPDAHAMHRAPLVLRDREADLEELEILKLGRELEQRRGPSDVCWIEGDDPAPLVTIRIATYNRGELVADRAIASALNQTYENIEVLVVGDACDEETAAAIRAIDDPRLRFIRLPTRGLYPSDPEQRWMVAGGHPMLTALDLARGTWIAPCDDDDELTPNHVDVLLDAAKRRRLEMVWSVAECETRKGTWTRIGQEPLQCGHITHGSVLYSLGLRNILPNVRSWRIGEPGDWNLWRRMHNIGVRMGFVDQVTYIHYAEARHRQPARVGSTS